MKKWGSILWGTLFLLLSAGCHAKQTLAQDLGCFAYPNTTWDMTADEFFSAARIDPAGFQVSSEMNGETHVHSTVYFTQQDQVFWGREAGLEITFTSVAFSEKEHLSKIVLQFCEPLSESEFAGFCGYLADMLESQESSYEMSGGWPSNRMWYVHSTATTDDFPKEFRQKVNSYYMYVLNEPDNTDAGGTSYIDQFSPRWLTQLTAVYLEDTKLAGATFNGTTLSQWLGAAEAYDALAGSP